METRGILPCWSIMTYMANTALNNIEHPFTENKLVMSGTVVYRTKELHSLFPVKRSKWQSAAEVKVKWF